MAAAIAAGVVTEATACGANAAGSADEAVSADGFSVCALLSLDGLDFVRVRGAVTVFVEALPAAPASEVCLAAGSLSSAVPVTFSFAEASRELLVEVSRDRALSLVEDASSARRCDVDVCWAAELASWVSAGRLEASSVPKSSLCAERSGRAIFCCAT
jgi:hypothetical protein